MAQPPTIFFTMTDPMAAPVLPPPTFMDLAGGLRGGPDPQPPPEQGA